MLKELIPVLIRNEMTREMYEELTIGWFRNELKPEGKPYYDDFIAKMQRGEKIFLPHYNNMFLGFDQNSSIKGLDNLKGLENRPVLALLNHTNNNGPMGGGWKIVTLSYHMYETTGNKIRPMHGYDPTARHDLFRERLNKSIDSIPIRDPDPLQGGLSLIHAIKNRDSMCLYPEGGFGPRDNNLRKGMSDAGRLIRMCLTRNYGLVTVSFRFKNDTFFATFDRIEKEEIPTLEGTAKNAIDQNVVDYCMKRISRHLPLNHQGYYKHL